MSYINIHINKIIIKKKNGLNNIKKLDPYSININITFYIIIRKVIINDKIRYNN